MNDAVIGITVALLTEEHPILAPFFLNQFPPSINFISFCLDSREYTFPSVGSHNFTY